MTGEEPQLFGQFRFTGRLFGSDLDAGNLHSGQLPAMPHRAMVTLPPAVFKGDDLLVFALLDDFAGDGCARDHGRAVGELIGIRMHDDFAENSFFAWIKIEKINIDNVTFGDAMLSAAGFDDCECHGVRKAGEIHTRGRC